MLVNLQKCPSTILLVLYTLHEDSASFCKQNFQEVGVQETHHERNQVSFAAVWYLPLLQPAAPDDREGKQGSSVTANSSVNIYWIFIYIFLKHTVLRATM